MLRSESIARAAFAAPTSDAHAFALPDATARSARSAPGALIPQRTGDDGDGESLPALADRLTPLLALPLAGFDAPAGERLVPQAVRTAVVEWTTAARTAGLPAARMLVRLKWELARALAECRHRVGDERRRRAMAEQLVSAAIEAYFAPGPGQSGRAEPPEGAATR